ncbi:DUF5652 family protein [Nanoarchaeota archaeon]
MITDILANPEPWMIAVAMIWTLPWKGVALWKSARNGQMIWFVALLLINTLALLEIIYLAFFQKKAAKKKPTLKKKVRKKKKRK